MKDYTSRFTYFGKTEMVKVKSLSLRHYLLFVMQATKQWQSHMIIFDHFIPQQLHPHTLLWDLSTATTSPSSPMRIAIAVVFPPGAAHMSSIRSPFRGSMNRKESKMVFQANNYPSSHRDPTWNCIRIHIMSKRDRVLQTQW